MRFANEWRISMVLESKCRTKNEINLLRALALDEYLKINAKYREDSYLELSNKKVSKPKNEPKKHVIRLVK